MAHGMKIKLIDRLDRVYEFEVFPGQSFKHFLLTNYIPASSIILKVNGQITDDQNYVIAENDDIDLRMVRAYQLPEYCQMLELWHRHPQNHQNAHSIYTTKFLWFNNSGICELKHAHIPKSEYVAWLETKFIESIQIAQLLNKNDHICLPLSGGRDSLALLYLLARTKHKLPSFSVVGVTVAPTVASVGDLEIASEAIRSLGIQDYHILDANYVKKTMNLKSEFLAVMDKALSNQGRGMTISLWHGIMKSCIERFCRENDVNKIAYGYQFEDLTASLLRSSLLGISFGESMQKKNLGQFQLIFPLWAITKKELTIYLNLVAPNHHSGQSNPTQYDRGDHNRDIHYFLADMLSTLYPGIGHSLFTAYKEFNQRYGVKPKHFFSCGNCGAVFTDYNVLNSDLKYQILCSTCDYFTQIDEIELQETLNV